MIFKYIKKRIEREKEKMRLEDRVVRFMRKVSELKDEQPKLAYRYLIQAANIYHDRLGGYVPEIDSEFNLHFNHFMNSYPPTVIPNKKIA